MLGNRFNPFLIYLEENPSLKNTPILQKEKKIWKWENSSLLMAIFKEKSWKGKKIMMVLFFQTYTSHIELIFRGRRLWMNNSMREITFPSFSLESNVLYYQVTKTIFF